MSNPLTSKITVPIDVAGTITNVTFDIKDAEARARIAELGQALYWVGVTTTALTEGATTNPIVINSESVTANVGGVAQYNGTEFVWNGSAWQILGQGDLGALAYKNSASGTYTPAGSITVNEAADTTTSVPNVTAVGTLPSLTYNSATEELTFNAGSLPTLGTAITVVTASGARTASFTGTEATITVS